jgi:hypothetical protein
MSHFGLGALGLLLATGSAPTDDARKALPFVVDDYAKALDEARAQKLPLFIEAWAPW